MGVSRMRSLIVYVCGQIVRANVLCGGVEQSMSFGSLAVMSCKWHQCFVYGLYSGS